MFKNKLLIASLAVVALGATTGCNNTKKITAGLPYTLVRTDRELADDEQLILGFNYTGANMQVYWSDNIETPSTEQFHIFTGGDGKPDPYFIIKGDITSLSFTYEDGKSIGRDNDEIRVIILSNTITSLPKSACASLFNLRTVYIPNTVEQIGEYAFSHGYYDVVFFCEAETRPNTWSPNWYYAPIFDNAINWGYSYYIDEDGQAYILYSKEGLHLANYMGFAFPTDDIERLVIPQTIKIDDSKFDIFAIFDLGYASQTVEELEIHNKVEYIGTRALAYCDKLKKVEFVGDFDFLYLGDYIFEYCEELESVTLPNGLVNLPYCMFEYCRKLTDVNIPGTVQFFSDDVFRKASNNKILNIDLTGYKAAKSIPYCSAEDVFYRCSADEITFTFAKSVGDKSAFTDKGWPKKSIEDASITWQAAED